MTKFSRKFSIRKPPPKLINKAVEDRNGEWLKASSVARFSFQLSDDEREKEEENLQNVDQLPNLLHAISIVRLLRSANRIISVAVIVYGFLYKLLSYPEDRVSRLKATDYRFHSFLIDYGACSLLVFEVALSVKLFKKMLTYQRAMYAIRQRMIETQDCKAYRDLNQTAEPAQPLLSSMDSGITCLRQEIEALNRKRGWLESGGWEMEMKK